MDAEEKIDLVCKPPTEEIITREELRELFEANSKPKHYVGLEVSGLLHIGTLLMNGFKIRDFQRAGIECTVFLADWHSVINNKLGGDWEKIRKASDYYAKAFRFFCPGAKIVLGSELYKGNDDYWRDLILFSKHLTLARSARCLTIMGRSEKEKLDLAQYFYPSMQAVDIHALGADIAHAGMDQRKAHMLARDVFPKMGWKKPVAVHHSLLPGLAKPVGGEGEEAEIAGKMSKSKPESCIFVHDSRKQIEEKLAKAFCPERVVEGNPVLEFARQIVFHEFSELHVEREKRFGGSVSFTSFEELRKAFAAGELHPTDLKNAVAKSLNEIVSPVRALFEKDAGSLKVFEDARITR